MISPVRNQAFIAALVAVVLSGCGGDEPTLSSGSADELHAQVAAVREAAGKGERDAALEALDGLGARVRELESGGSLAEVDATALRRGIGRAKRRVRQEVAAPAPAATATPAATAPPEAPDGEEGGEPGTGNDEQKGKGETEGKGNGKAKGKKGKP
jgi:hypothetical protein